MTISELGSVAHLTLEQQFNLLLLENRRLKLVLALKLIAVQRWKEVRK